MEYPRLPIKLNRARKMTQAMIDEAIQLYQNGGAITEIGESMGVSYGTIWRYLDYERVRASEKRNWEKQKLKPDYKKKHRAYEIKSEAYRAKVHGEKWKKWKSFESNNRQKLKKSFNQQ